MKYLELYEIRSQWQSSTDRAGLLQQDSHQRQHFVTGISQLVRPASCPWYKQTASCLLSTTLNLLWQPFPSAQYCSVSTGSKITDPSFPNSSSWLQKVAGELRLTFKRRILHFQRRQTMLIHTNTNQLTSGKVKDQILLSIIGVKTVKTGYKEISNKEKKLLILHCFLLWVLESYTPITLWVERRRQTWKQ